MRGLRSPRPGTSTWLRVGQQLLGVAAFDLDVLGVLGGRAQRHGDVAGDQVAGDRDHGRVADRAAGEDGHVGGAGADVHHGHAQLALVVGQHGLAGGQRVEQQLLHFQAAAAHALDDVLGRALRAGHDVHLGLQADAAHADGLLHVLAVDHELLRLHQQQALVDEMLMALAVSITRATSAA
jgi:hypothetical protein